MSTYSTNLRLELIGTGEQQGTWGSTTNVNLGTLLEQAIGGYDSITVTDGSDTTLTTANGASDQARNMTLNLTGTLSAARTVICPSAEKVYIVKNATTGGYAVTFKVSGQTGVSIPNGSTVILYVDGTDARLVSQFPVPVTLGGTGTTTSTGSGNVVLSTSPTLVTPNLGTPSAATLTNATGLPLTTGVTGTLPVANGGTGVTASTGSGNVVLSTSPTLTSPTLTSPTLTTPNLGTPSAATLTNATGLPLTTGVTGTLPVANGGTGVTSSTGTGSVVLSASPTFTGTPAAPTAAGGTNTTQIATTAFVQTAVSSGGGMTLLGTITTTSGSSQSISGLDLTSYKQLTIVFNRVSHGDGTNNRFYLLGTSSADDVQISGGFSNSTLVAGFVFVDLSTGVASATLGEGSSSTNPYPAVTAITNSSTAVSVAVSAGSFDAGSVLVYGVK